MPLYDADYARFQEPGWVNGKGDERLPRSTAYKITKEVAAHFSPLIAAELKKRLGMTDNDVADFLAERAKYPHSPFADYLSEMIDEQLYDFIREEYRAD